MGRHHAGGAVLLYMTLLVDMVSPDVTLPDFVMLPDDLKLTEIGS